MPDFLAAGRDEAGMVYALPSQGLTGIILGYLPGAGRRGGPWWCTIIVLEPVEALQISLLMGHVE